MTTNPALLTLPINCQGTVSAISNAAYTQLVSVHVGNDVPTATFVGTGENVPMLYNGVNQFDFLAVNTTRAASLLFQYNPGNGYHNSFVNVPVTITNPVFTEITVESEDATDHDNNDTVLSLICFTSTTLISKSPGLSTAQVLKAREFEQKATPRIHAKDLSGTLAERDDETHKYDMSAKTSYKLPGGVISDDLAISVQLSPSGDKVLSSSASSSGWGHAAITAFIKETKLGDLLYVGVEFTDSVAPELKGNWLILTTAIPYTKGSSVLLSLSQFPAEKWFAVLYGTEATVASVTA